MKYCEVDHRLVAIPALLESWDKTLRELEKAFGIHDLPYVYRERTNVGILAAAATKLGYLTFEEYSVEKRRQRRWRQGRADLYICSKDSRKEFNIEAKYKVVSFRNQRLAQTIAPILETVIKDVVVLRKSEHSRRIGIVFLRPWGAKPDDFDPTPFWSQLRDRASYGADFCAFHLCKFEIWSQQETHNDCPGIAVVGKYA